MKDIGSVVHQQVMGSILVEVEFTEPKMEDTSLIVMLAFTFGYERWNTLRLNFLHCYLM
jgi:hypothetical protein